MKNYFVEAYLKNKRLKSFWEDYLVKSRVYTPYITGNKMYFKKRSIKPLCSLKPHIFINNGRQS